MAQNITLLGASYTAVPAVTLPKTGGGTAKFSDASVTTAVESDVAEGKTFLLADGSIGMGTASGGGGGYTRTVIAEEQTVTPVSTSLNGSTYYGATLNVSEGFEADAEYIITFNGTEYFFTCQVLWGTNFVLGDINYFYGGSSLPYPFGILWVSGTTCTLARDNGNQVTVKIEKLELTGSGGGSSTLITKNITTNGTYSASDDSADGYSSVTVNVNHTDSIVVKSRDSDGYPTELDYYNSDGIVPAQTFCNTRSAGVGGWCYGRVTKINLKGSDSFKVYGDAFRGMHALTDPDFSKITELANNGSNNTGNQATFRSCGGLLTVNAPNLIGGLPVYCFFDCKKLVSVYLPKINAINGYSSNRGSFGNCILLKTCEFGSVGYPILFVQSYAFHSCPAIETMTFYAKSDYVDELLANVRNCVTTGTIIVKASEATTYGGTSYAAGDTIVTSTP